MGNLILPESKINQAISIPFQAAGFTAQEKATARQNLGITNAAYVFKGQVTTVSALPQGAQIGDMYYVTAASSNYAWDGTAWINIGNSMTGYVPYNAPIALTAAEQAQAQQNIGLTYTELTDLKMLGYTVPKEMPIQNYTLNGVYHQRVGRIDLGGLNWYFYQNPNRLNASFTDIKYVNTNTAIKAYTPRYATYSFNASLSNDKVISAYGNGATSNSLVVLDSAYTDATAFRNSVQGLYLYYELATEITFAIDGNEATNNSMLSDQWSSTKTYQLGELCIYKNSLWSCKQAHTNLTPTEGVYWTKTSVANELYPLVIEYSSLRFSKIGRLVVINGYLGGLSLNASSSTLVANLPSGIPAPRDDIRCVCNVGDNAYTAQRQGYLTIGTNGEVRVLTVSGTATTFYVSCSYVF